jgi:hypothetical protein
MFLFILSVLSICIVAFLLMIAVQLIRIEKAIANSTDLVELHVRKLYRHY